MQPIELEALMSAGHRFGTAWRGRCWQPGVVKHLAVLIAVVGSVSVPLSGYALTTLRISANSGVSWVTIRDSRSNPDGIVSFDGSIGASGWSLVASGNSGLGPLTEPSLEVLAGTVTSTKAGTLLIEFSQTDYGPLPAGNSFTTTLNSHNVGNGRTTMWSYMSTGNNLFQRSTLLGATLQNTATDDTDSSVSSDALAAITHAYSLTIRLSIFHNGAGTSSFDARLDDPPRGVPDGGATVVLLGAALLLLTGAATWMKRLQTA